VDLREGETKMQFRIGEKGQKGRLKEAADYERGTKKLIHGLRKGGGDGRSGSRSGLG